MNHQVGDVIRVTATFTDLDGQPTSPAAATFLIKPPGSETPETEVAFPFPGAAVEDLGTGQLRLTIPRSVTIDGGPGTYMLEAWALGANAKMLPSEFIVDKRRLLTEPPV
jgi:hypothetical protein